MTDHPIMFSAPMIIGLDREATEQGTGKSMTSRLAWGDSFAASDDAVQPSKGWHHDGGGFYRRPTPWQRVQVGDRLWVRENFWRYGYWVSEKKAGKVSLSFRGLGQPARDPEVLVYAAGTAAPSDAGYSIGKVGQQEPAWHLRPNIFLPRAESRFTLVITAAKIRRLQAIAEVECEREGLYWKNCLWTCPSPDGGDWHAVKDAKECFRWLWTKLHGAGAWEENPEIVALTFTVHKQNIDSLKQAA